MLELLERIPSDLTKLYAQMIQRIRLSPYKESYRRAISAAVLAYRPLAVSEMMMLADEAQRGDDENFLENSGLLTVRDGIVNLLHQSTLDYLKERPDDGTCELFPQGYANAHVEIVRSSLESMTVDLADEDIRLKSAGTPLDGFSDLDYMVAIRYSCRYWVDHFCAMPETVRSSDQDMYDEILTFLKVHLLDWLVALCLMRELPPTLLSIRRLQKLLQEAINSRHQHEQSASQLLRLIGDADRFCRLSKDGIEECPLQVYCCASLFTPGRSMIRELFQAQRPDFITTAPILEEDWNACQQTYKIKNKGVKGVFWDVGKLASAFGSDMEFMDLETGSRSKWSEPNILYAQNIVFSPDGELLASWEGKTVEIWNVTKRKMLSVMEITGEVVDNTGAAPLTLSPSRPEIAVCTRDSAGSWVFSVYDLEGIYPAASVLQMTPNEDFCTFHGLVYSRDGSSITTSGADVRVWDVRTGVCKSVVDEEPFFDPSGLFSPPSLSGDGKRLAMMDMETRSLSIWNVESAKASLLRRLSPQTEILWNPDISQSNCCIFLSDSHLVAATFSDNAIHLFNACNGDRLVTLSGHRSRLYSLSCSKDGRLLASASFDDTMKLWDISQSQSEGASCHNSEVYDISIAPDSSWFASSNADSVKMWSIDGICERTFAGRRSNAMEAALAISPCSELLGTVDNGDFTQDPCNSNDIFRAVTQERRLTVFSKNNNSCIRTCNLDGLECVRFSPCGKLIAAANRIAVMLWRLADLSDQSSPEIWTMERPSSEYSDGPVAFAFSADGKSLATEEYSTSPFIRIWDLDNSRERDRIPLQGLGEPGYENQVFSLAFSQNGKWLLSCTWNQQVQVWDVKHKTLLLDFYRSGITFMQPSFIDNGPLIRTNKGAILLPQHSPLGDPSERKVAGRPRGPGISRFGEWITWNGKNLLWLPPSYRPTASDVRDRTVVIGCGSGQVFVITFKD